MTLTIGIISAGAMGSGIAQHLTATGDIRVLTYLDGRSASTRQRASEAGMHDCTLASVVNDCSIILSVVPPSEAVALAQKLVEVVTSLDEAAALSSSPKTSFSADALDPPIYCDLNAVSPESSKRIAGIVKPKFRYVDGCVIGGPPKDSYQPTIYLSGKNHEATEHVREKLSHNGKGLKLRILDSQGDGAASALKLSYAGLTKGFTGLAVSMILAASKQSPATAEALLQELSESQPAFLASISRTVPGCISKAYRFVGEMEEIASYVDTNLGHDTGDQYRGLAKIYQAVADDHNGEGEKAEALRDFAERAKSTSASSEK